MKEIYHAIKMSDGGFVRFQQDYNWSVDVYSSSIVSADMWGEKDMAKQTFNELLKGHDNETEFNFVTEAKPEEIVKVTIEVEGLS